MKDYLNHKVDPTDPDLISVIDELPLWSAPFGLKLLDTIKMRKNIHVLDLGCGLGFPLVELSQRLGQTCKIFGIDPWSEALDRVRIKLKVYDIRNVEIVPGSAENMPFEDMYFDLIVSNNGINNVQDMGKVFSECFRVCKDNAQMVFTLNTNESMYQFYGVFREVLKEEKLDREIEKLEQHIYSKRRPIDEIKTLAEHNGFSVINQFHDSFELGFVDGTTMLNHYQIKYWFLESWKEIMQMKDLDRIFSIVETRLNTLSEIKGKFSLTIPFVTFDCRK